MLILILFGVLIGVLSSLSGLGGGFLVVPFLIYMGKKAQLAVGTSFLVIFLIAISSLAAHGRFGNIEWKTGLLLAVGGVVGAQIGPVLLQQVPEIMFKRGFACLIIGIGCWLFWTTRSAA
ncbi:MAG: sulfite exporter TauE/SafE family protein [Candidatus Nitronauta litoralis]|uniref:Probable membrane transporter protein n=1 Tax=Candidatus Nitronauta litoralis TaxID=2705533 RepID=A0A7T0BZM5_9BACT|nr:MAG: sulfite exporter TauE/SafE family protein [Candidatus Nitronauta litoralis]